MSIEKIELAKTEAHQVVKRNGVCHNALLTKKCSFWQHEKDIYLVRPEISNCKLFNLPLLGDSSLVMCNNIYGAVYEGRV